MRTSTRKSTHYFKWRTSCIYHLAHTSGFMYPVSGSATHTSASVTHTSGSTLFLVFFWISSYTCSCTAYFWSQFLFFKSSNRGCIRVSHKVVSTPRDCNLVQKGNFMLPWVGGRSDSPTSIICTLCYFSRFDFHMFSFCWCIFRSIYIIVFNFLLLIRIDPSCNHLPLCRAPAVQMTNRWPAV